jgi:dolichol-phosphate mannosyltransferase
MLLLYGTGLHYLALGLPGVDYSNHLELVPVGWRDLARQVNAIADDVRKRTGQDPVIAGMDRYEIASQLSFYMPPHNRPLITSRNLFGEQGLMYERWASSLTVADRPLVLVAWDPHDLSDEITANQATLEPQRQGVLSRDGVVIRDFLYRTGSYRTGRERQTR